MNRSLGPVHPEVAARDVPEEAMPLPDIADGEPPVALLQAPKCVGLTGSQREDNGLLPGTVDTHRTRRGSARQPLLGGQPQHPALVLLVCALSGRGARSFEFWVSIGQG